MGANRGRQLSVLRMVLGIAVPVALLLAAFRCISVPAHQHVDTLGTVEAMCQQGRLEMMPSTSCNSDRPDRHQLMVYLERAPQIDGWVVPLQLTVVRTIDSLQIDHCITGSVGEIGVHHGRFFYMMAAMAKRKEPKVAIDVFQHQELNIDQSGGNASGKLEAFERHGRALGYDTEKDLTIISADSTTLTPRKLARQGIPAFRFLSVDGSHVYATVLKDMELAACSIHDAGVFVVNDFVNHENPGVIEAVSEFLDRYPHMAPFLWTCNKLYFTHAAYHELYLTAARANACLACSMDRKLGKPHESRYTLGRWQICTAQKNCTKAIEHIEGHCF